MSNKNNREIETKWLVDSEDLNSVRSDLEGAISNYTKSIFGSSVDTYWTPHPDAVAQFVRMRERDGIRQLTVKAKDKGGNINRLEIDLDTTSPVEKIEAFFNALFGEHSGKVGKTYYVYWPGSSDYTTICAYSISHVKPKFSQIVIEIEAVNEKRLHDLENTILGAMRQKGYTINPAPGSLFEMFIQGVDQ